MGPRPVETGPNPRPPKSTAQGAMLRPYSHCSAGRLSSANEKIPELCPSLKAML